MPDAERILKIAATAKERLCSQERPVLLDIGCHNQMELNLLPAVIRQLKEEFSQLRPYVHLVPFDSLLSLLEVGQIHVMFGLKDTYSRAALHYRELFCRPLACICSKDHPMAQYDTLEREQLKGCIILCEPHKMADSIFQIQSSFAAMTTVHERYLGDGYEGTLALVKAGMGYTIYPDLDTVRDPELRYIPITDCPEYSFGLYHLASDENGLIKRFWQLLKETPRTW